MEGQACGALPEIEEALLHHYQLSNWILYSRAYAVRAGDTDEVVRSLDAELRAAPDSLGWLEEHWLE